MDEQQRQRHVSDVAAEAQLEHVAARGDDGVSRRQLTARARHGVVGDQMTDDVDLRQVGVSSHVEVTGRQASDGMPSRPGLLTLLCTTTTNVAAQN